MVPEELKQQYVSGSEEAEKQSDELKSEEHEQQRCALKMEEFEKRYHALKDEKTATLDRFGRQLAREEADVSFLREVYLPG